MKKIILSLIIIVFVSLVCFLNLKNDNLVNTPSPDSIQPAFLETGNIPEKIIGDTDKADLIIYEYADFGCPHCADWNKIINDLMDKYNGKIALVFRSYNLGFKNGVAAAHAATAAQIQGYFKEYKDLLFSNQAEWTSKSKSEAEDLFVEYFEKISGDAGNIEKFKEDIKSEAVEKRLEFENKLGKKINLRGTPMFRIDGETIELAELIKTIENKLSTPLSE